MIKGKRTPEVACPFTTVDHRPRTSRHPTRAPTGTKRPRLTQSIDPKCGSKYDQKYDQSTINEYINSI